MNDNTYKICDYGCSKENIDVEVSHTKKIGSEAYTSPE